MKNLILKYIPYLNINHILEYAQEENIILSREEANTIYLFIKDNIKGLLDDNQTIYLLKGKIRHDLFDKIIILYQENKKKYL